METTEYRLGDVCKLRNGYAFKSENFTNEGVPVIRISNINDNEATVDKALKTNPSTVFEKFAVKKGDILIAMSGATTGKFGIYNSEQKAYQNQRVGCFVIIDEEKLSNDYLYLLLNGLKRKIETDAYGGGQPNISSTIIENYNVHLPSLKEQEKIVGVLNQAEQLVKQRKKSILLFDEFLKSTFLKMFGDPLLNSKKIRMVTLSDIAIKAKNAIVDGPFGSSLNSNDYYETGIPIIRINNIRDEGFFNEEFKYINEEKYNQHIRSKVEFNDLLIARVGNTIGKTCIFNQKYTALLSTTGVAKATIDSSLANLKFIAFQMRLPQYIKYIWSQTDGAGQPYLNLKKIKGFRLLLPDKAVQDEFSEIVNKTESLTAHAKKGLKELENLLGSLTQRAFRGDLNIVERIEISGSIKIQPKISAEVIAIDNMNKQLADFHNSIANSGAPIEIDNKLKQLDAELKLRGEIPFWDEYVKYRLIKEKQTIPFTFEKLWKEITAFPFESVPDYDTVKKMIFKLLNSDNPFLKQRFNESDKQIELLLNETTSA